MHQDETAVDSRLFWTAYFNILYSGIYNLMGITTQEHKG